MVQSPARLSAWRGGEQRRVSCKSGRKTGRSPVQVKGNASGGGSGGGGGGRLQGRRGTGTGQGFRRHEGGHQTAGDGLGGTRKRRRR
ncbi:UNVERIFIED_CONTAM: hypothetical protein Sradi_1039800 [Sesamum radiatum]|uniref:Uncharacterized protein n=1 Tax=Sesamum radiatum TaxID=300843 RepID=A0AAW2V5K0_SESRA